ncbi:MAG: hypothetical protein K2O29_04995 [Ruminococcus sp.]|nr:hypothetical protein [Ruminococcus sp.]MDE6848043.1 hypothetical protein [Ruminococcus sp.]MDE7137798.1 hypothetical protein [Ruminococcus sp.]
MAFCKFCGRQLTDGEVCNCQSLQGNQSNDMNNGFNPTFNNQYTDSNDGDIQSESKGKKKLTLMIAGIAVIFIIILSLLSALIAGNSYKKPFNRIVRGVNKNDIELILEQFMTEDMMEEVKDEIEDETDGDWKEFCKDAEEVMEEMKEYLEDDFGKNVKFSVKFLDKDDAKKREIKNLEKLYALIDDDIEIKKAYKIKLELRIKGKDDDEDIKLNLYSVNIKGEGWKIMIDNDIINDLENGIEDIIDTDIYKDIIEDIL